MYWRKIKDNYYLYDNKGKYIKALGKPPKENFDVVYADPPWRYDFSKSKSRAIESHYGTLPLDDICNLKISAKKDSVLFLWATAPKIREALQVMESWGFEYKTNMVWVKEKIGMGYHARGRHELLFIGIKGKGKLNTAIEKYESVILQPRGVHSKKPEIVYTIIEASYPNCSYLELFARNTREGWASWGDEIG